MNIAIRKRPCHVVSLLALVLIPACDTTPEKGVAVGPMVQNVTENGFTVVWYDHNPGDIQCTARAETNEIFNLRAIKGDKSGRRVAVFRGLDPNKEYTYHLGDIEAKPEYKTRTAPPSKRTDDESFPEFRILAFGDSGKATPEQFELAEKMTEYHPALVVHTGDLIYPDGAREDYPEKFYKPYARLLASAPLYPCLGNHDIHTLMGGPMFDEFVLPANGPNGETPERNYWFDYGPVRFVAVDTNVPLATLQDPIAPWMDKVLSDTEPRWKICFFHHPVYTNANYGSTRKLWNTIVPVMEKRGVQLVLSGHDHLYEHSYPIRAQKIVEPGEGIVYITTGAGGAALYTERPTSIPELKSVYDGAHSFTIIDVTRDALKLRQINIKDAVIDEFEIPHHVTEPNNAMPAQEKDAA